MANFVIGGLPYFRAKNLTEEHEMFCLKNKSQEDMSGLECILSYFLTFGILNCRYVLYREIVFH